MTACLLAIGLAACPDGEGRVIGEIPGAAEALRGRCIMPCQSAADCPRPANAQTADAFFDYVWQCLDGQCVAADCVQDLDCNGNTLGFGNTCRQNQCAVACDAVNPCADMRDRCIDGFCIRVPEVNAPPCTRDADCGQPGFQDCTDPPCVCDHDGYCAGATDPRCAAPDDCPPRDSFGLPYCRVDDDCEEWASCRENGCREYQTDGDPTGWGRSCITDSDCRARHMAQGILNNHAMTRSIATNMQFSFSACEDLCTPGDPMAAPCGDGLVCVSVPSPTEWSTTPRNTCLPVACSAAGGCTSSLGSCRDDSQCPGGETCTWPVTPCPGVCLNASCSGCATWFDQNSLHTCRGAGAPINIDIIRPD